MEFLFLGSLVVRSGEREVSISAPRQRVVLTALLLNPNKVISVDRIARLVWDDPLPPSAAATVRTYVMRLRQVLGAAGADRIVTRAPGYLLQAAEHEIDLGRFQAHRRVAKRLAEHDDLPGAVAELDHGLALWRNDPFLDVPSPRLRDSEGAHLRELRLQALGWRADMQLALNRHAELLPELRQIVREQPLNEAFVGRLMLALARTGQQPEALELYQSTRAALIGEFGMEPGSELRGIQGRILRAEYEPPPAPVTVRGEPPLPGPDEPAAPEETPLAPPAQLPPAVPDFTAREPESRELAELLAGTGTAGVHPAPVAVITGGPGAGKTSLLLRVAHAVRDEFPDGQLYAGAGDGADPAQVAGRFLLGLGVPEHAIPRAAADRMAKYRSVIAQRRVLVVLDDVTSGAQVAPLMPGLGASRVLVSSRYRLADLDWSHTVWLRGLTEGESLGLLERIIGRDRARAEPAAARWIAHACGGLPLALRAAGLRLLQRPNRGLDAAARRICDPRQALDELQLGGLSLRAALDRAYDGLAARLHDGADMRPVFRRLGMMTECCIRPRAVGALLEVSPDRAEELLDDLVDAHLLLAESGGRYRMPWLTWVYARERMYTEELSGYYVAAVDRLARHRHVAPDPECGDCSAHVRPAGLAYAE